MEDTEIKTRAEKLGGDLAVEFYREVIRQDEWDLFMRLVQTTLTEHGNEQWDAALGRLAAIIHEGGFLNRINVADAEWCEEEIHRLKRSKA